MKEAAQQAIDYLHREGPKLTLYLGFATMLDSVIHLTTEKVHPLLDGLDAQRLAERIANPRYMVHDVYDFWSGVWLQAAQGKGGDWKLEDATTFEWMMDTFSGKWQIGGAAGQGAATLARLGVRPRLNVPWREQKLLDLFPDGVLVAAPDGFLAARETAVSTHTTTIHPIFEFDTGFQMRVGQQTVVASKSDRLIIPFDPTRKEFRIEPSYETALLNDTRPKTILVSGFLVPGEVVHAKTAVNQAVAHLQKLKQPSQALIHLELGECNFPQIRQHINSGLLPYVNSLGLNESELLDLATDLGFSLAHHEDITAVINFCHAVVKQHNLQRINVHTASYSLAVSQLDPILEQQALMFGNLTAAFRATHAGLGTLAELEAFLPVLDLNPKKILLREGVDVWERENGRFATYNTIFCPTFALPTQRQSIGLGDSYMAATLAVLTPM
ncbi:MAG: ADP-dependent glucokinase/phosphofructokinase [Chloroflexota bacterium]